MALRFDRTREHAKMRRWVERGHPRLAMLGMITLTAAVGFLTSVFLLHHGVDRMALRWLLGVLAAYATFLVLLRVWLLVAAGIGPDARFLGEAAGRTLDAVAEDPGGAWDLANHALRGARGPGGPVDLGLVEVEAPSSGFDLPVPDLDLDLEGIAFAIVVTVLAALTATALIVSVWLVWTAPGLLAEVALDATFGGLVYRSIRGRPLVQEPWSAAARATWGPALLVLVMTVSAALVIEQVAPGVHTAGQAVHAVLHPRPR
ncbi:MAG: hypothetical protein QM704_02795 [Anaeromyxobacteraceae bacterium]